MNDFHRQNAIYIATKPLWKWKNTGCIMTKIFRKKEKHRLHDDKDISEMGKYHLHDDKSISEKEKHLLHDDKESWEKE